MKTKPSFYLRGALLCAAVGAAATSQAMPADKLFATLSPSVWRVLTYDMHSTPMRQGSAVVIGPERLITNCHVLARAKSFVIRHENQTLDARLEHIDLERDMCQITARNLKAPAVQIGDSEKLAVGQKIYTLGAPRNLELTLSDGLISSLRKNDQLNLKLIQITAPITTGSSGGGLFDEEGRLIGITTAIIRDYGNLNIAIPINWLHELPSRSAAALAKREQASEPAPVTPVAAAVLNKPARVETAPARTPAVTPAEAPTSAPPPSGYADLKDVAKLNKFGVQKGYEEFLKSPLPRAFAFTDDGRWWNASGMQSKNQDTTLPPYMRILSECESEYQRRCHLYAVNNYVVYKPGATPYQSAEAGK